MVQLVKTEILFHSIVVCLSTLNVENSFNYKHFVGKCEVSIYVEKHYLFLAFRSLIPFLSNTCRLIKKFFRSRMQTLHMDTIEFPVKDGGFTHITDIYGLGAKKSIFSAISTVTPFHGLCYLTRRAASVQSPCTSILLIILFCQENTKQLESFNVNTNSPSTLLLSLRWKHN